jgi:hypothetical protein
VQWQDTCNKSTRQPAAYGISADDRILIDYWRKQLIAAMLSGDEDGSVQANVMLHKLVAKYKNPITSAKRWHRRLFK